MNNYTENYILSIIKSCYKRIHNRQCYCHRRHNYTVYEVDKKLKRKNFIYKFKYQIYVNTIKDCIFKKDVEIYYDEFSSIPFHKEEFLYNGYLNSNITDKIKDLIIEKLKLNSKKDYLCYGLNSTGPFYYIDCSLLEDDDSIFNKILEKFNLTTEEYNLLLKGDTKVYPINYNKLFNINEFYLMLCKG